MPLGSRTVTVVVFPFGNVAWSNPRSTCCPLVTGNESSVSWPGRSNRATLPAPSTTRLPVVLLESVSVTGPTLSTSGVTMIW
ncbi:hypothetical protein [Fodinicola feengrottensis]|uniref:hypothetical protein n=1 Tax=Fodinicola feengrottensis TaxID=435914 RepID=UPI0024435FD6|nr:hypothetical protein [Fodinicola feengrottensis]